MHRSTVRLQAGSAVPPAVASRTETPHVAATLGIATTDADPQVRWGLVARVRAEIAAGEYETTVKWEAALDRLLGEMTDGRD